MSYAIYEKEYIEKNVSETVFYKSMTKVYSFLKKQKNSSTTRVISLESTTIPYLLFSVAFGLVLWFTQAQWLVQRRVPSGRQSSDRYVKCLHTSQYAESQDSCFPSLEHFFPLSGPAMQTKVNIVGTVVIGSNSSLINIVNSKSIFLLLIKIFF